MLQKVLSDWKYKFVEKNEIRAGSVLYKITGRRCNSKNFSTNHFQNIVKYGLKKFNKRKKYLQIYY